MSDGVVEATCCCACAWWFCCSPLCGSAHRMIYFDYVETSCWRYVTCNFFGIGWLIDGCNMQGLVDQENALRRARVINVNVNVNGGGGGGGGGVTNNNNNNNNIVIQAPAQDKTAELMMMQMMMNQQNQQNMMMMQQRQAQPVEPIQQGLISYQQIPPQQNMNGFQQQQCASPNQMM